MVLDSSRFFCSPFCCVLVVFMVVCSLLCRLPSAAFVVDCLVFLEGLTPLQTFVVSDLFVPRDRFKKNRRRFSINLYQMQ